MKQNYLQKSIAAIWAIAFLLVAYSCSQIETFEPNMDSNDLAKDISKFKLNGPLVEPILWSSRSRPDTPPGQDKDNASGGGNVECSEVGDFEFSSGRNNYNDGEFENEWPEGLEVEVIDGKVYWSITVPEGYCLANMSVIVKGGPAANVYNYPKPDKELFIAPTSDGKLTAPINPNNDKPYGLSNLTFCWNLVEAPKPPTPEDDQEECYVEEIKLTAKATSDQDGVDIVWYDEEFLGEKVEDPSLDEVGTKTYWAEAVRNGCASARVPVKLTIWALPVAPESNGDQDEEICGGNILTASVKAVDGVTIVWYDKENKVVDNPSLSTVGTVTYYAEAVDDETDCVSTKRTAVTLTLKACPDGNGDGWCSLGETSYAGKEGEGINIGSGGAWFYVIDYDGTKETYPLWAGQTNYAGDVTIEPDGVDKVKITVDLADGVFLISDDDNWYIHGFEDKPTKKPTGQQGDAVTFAKGQADFDENPLVRSVNLFDKDENEAKFFTVHINVDKPCPPPQTGG